MSRKNASTCRYTGSAVALLLALASSANAAPPDPFANDVTAVRARHIITVNSGTIENGIVLIRNGKIVGVGADVKIPAGAAIINCDTVMPGIVGVTSQIGLSDAPAGAPSPAARGGGAGPGGGAGGGARAAANPHFRVIDELYPYDETWARLVREGVTTLSLVPPGTGIPGQGAIIHPVGDSVQAMTLAPNALLSVHFAANTQTMDLIRSTFEGVRPQPVDPNADPLSDFLPDGASRPAESTPPPPLPLGEAVHHPPLPLGEGRGEGETSGDTQVRRGQGRGGARPAGPIGPATGNQQARQEPVLRAFNGTIPTVISCPDNASVACLQPLISLIRFTCLQLRIAIEWRLCSGLRTILSCCKRLCFSNRLRKIV